MSEIREKFKAKGFLKPAGIYIKNIIRSGDILLGFDGLRMDCGKLFLTKEN